MPPIETSKVYFKNFYRGKKKLSVEHQLKSHQYVRCGFTTLAQHFCIDNFIFQI